ncbi:hypothetical protein GX50_03244 [[Emmonsia] crescens]|uniref:Uncharacterized protein n=1 Tax=[Emmonsia] crescens TaxID=73230 RepID=A0A2B7ZL64_9EURO|nr:hypothetical protein GX50_03244 [Emmonsia crescens]
MGVFKSYLTWVRLIACEKEFSKVMRLDVAENGSVVIDQPRGRSGQKLSTNPTCDLTGPETVLLLTAISRINRDDKNWPSRPVRYNPYTGQPMKPAPKRKSRWGGGGGGGGGGDGGGYGGGGGDGGGGGGGGGDGGGC